MKEIPQWWPEHKGIYDKDKSYKENFEQGPFFDGEFIERPEVPKDEWIDFLGHKVRSPLGVPAGPLLNSKWTTLAAKLGFDIPTYKTMRSKPHAGHPLPNVLFVDTKGPLDKGRMGETLKVREGEPQSMDHFAITNSFGMPSMDEDYLMADIEKANNDLEEGQVCIISVVGTPRDGEDFEADFARTAAMAKEAGAKIIEANFSCPNVASGEGSIFCDPETAESIAVKIMKEIGDIPLIIKAGYFTDDEIMRKFLVSIARAGAQAVCGINTIGMKVEDDHGNPALGENRLKSGICGDPIRGAAIEFLQKTQQINDQEKLGLTVLGTGGVTLPEHFDELIDAGADVSMSATGMMWDPYLAMRWHYNKANNR